MKSKVIGTVIRYGIITAIGFFLMWFVLWTNDYSTITDEARRFKVLADSFTVPGVILIMVGLLILLSSFGAVDGLAYALGGLFRRLIPGARHNEAEKETYYDYVMRKKAKQRPSLLPFFVVGGIFLAVSIIYIVRFYGVYQGVTM